jgi:hypothetical protein
MRAQLLKVKTTNKRVRKRISSREVRLSGGGAQHIHWANTPALASIHRNFMTNDTIQPRSTQQYGQLHPVKTVVSCMEIRIFPILSR